MKMDLFVLLMIFAMNVIMDKIKKKNNIYING